MALRRLEAAYPQPASWVIRAVVVIVWIVVDFFLGLGYGIYRLATRSR